jgi:adenylosuccinate synthase
MIKNVDVVVGCQFGSESKGLASAMIASKNKYDWLVSVNSSQAGHTAPYRTPRGEINQIVFRQLPASLVSDMNAMIYIGAGAVINLDVFIEEIHRAEKAGFPVRCRLFVDRNALVITQDHIEEEKGRAMGHHIGSTCEGVGSALAGRCLRTAPNMDDFTEWAKNYGIILVDNSMILEGDVLLEGSQGFGLSPYYGHYPYCTSRDTTTSAFLSYAQINPKKLRDVYGIYRTYPIRVGGNSGPMHRELTWEEIQNRSGYSKLGEFTTVTKRLRRIGEWDSVLAQRSAIVNGVTKPILMFVNYLDSTLESVTEITKFPAVVVDKINDMAEDVGQFWYAISTSKEGSWIYFE